MENIRKPWHNLVLNDYPLSFSRYEFPVVEALDVLWPSRLRFDHRAILYQPYVGQQLEAFRGKPVWHRPARILRLHLP